MRIKKTARDTLTVVEMFHGDRLEFARRAGSPVRIELLGTGAEIISTTLKQLRVEETRAKTPYRFWADLNINGDRHRLEREAGTQKSFYEPWVIGGATIWLDAVDAIFDFINETHGPCRPNATCSDYLPPRHHARIALQDAGMRICDESLHPWCPLPAGGLKIENCYQGEDCWMGAYFGASAHGGLDINHPAGTPLCAPIGLDDHFLYNSTEMGHNNNRWRGVRRWPDGSQWILTSCHMTRLIVPEGIPLERGRQYAEGAGVNTGFVEHSHFGFAIFDRGELIRLDPWILFWQMYQDQAGERALKAFGARQGGR